MTAAAEVKERPILFMDEMVRAIRTGRKTMTRRALKKQPGSNINPVYIEDAGCWQWATVASQQWCPYGEAGDRLWVREGVVKIGHEHRGRNGQYLWPKLSDTFTEETAKRWLDRDCVYTADTDAHDPIFDEPHGSLNKMFMPRWASRITLEIESVRVERLQEISEEDARAEGVTCRSDLAWGNGGVGDDMPAWAVAHGYRYGFRELWDSINGKGAWDRNEFVWVIGFRVL